MITLAMIADYSQHYRIMAALVRIKLLRVAMLAISPLSNLIPCRPSAMAAWGRKRPPSSIPRLTAMRKQPVGKKGG
jgi:hypothetical protein